MQKSVVSRGHKIGYRTEGSGPPLVLLAGFSSWADEWWDYGYVDELSSGFNVIAVDRLGHGQSDKPHDPQEYLEHLIVADVVAVLDAEGFDTAIVWGYSMGARNALSLAIMEPDRVSAVISGGSPLVLDGTGRRERILELAPTLGTTEALANWFKSAGASEEQVEEALGHNDAGALSASMAGTADWYPLPVDVHAPSLWYIGSDDGGFPPADLELVEGLDLETHLVPDADHVMAFVRAQDVLSIVQPFLDKHHI
jgi:pimeloyl-ACP methyl ester carboxylesterase